MARPRKELDFNTLAKLCEVHCTAFECAYFFEISIDTLDRRIKEEYDISFAEYKAQKETIGKTQLRRKQFDIAMKGNVPLLIFLGKNMLDQKDKTTTEAQINHHFTPAQLEEKAKIDKMSLKELVEYTKANLPEEI